MRYFIRKVGPGHAFGFGCVVGVVLALFPALFVILLGLAVPAIQPILDSLLGPLGQEIVADSPGSWWTTLLLALAILILAGLFYGIGGWLLALGYNLVARVTGGLALDLEHAVPGVTESSTPWSQDMPARVEAGMEPTMQLPKPLPGNAPDSRVVAGRLTPVSRDSNPVQDERAKEAKAPPKQQAWLIMAAGTQQTWGLQGDVIDIGRDASNQVVLAEDPAVEDFHAQIRVEPSGYVLYDRSQQGTLVNDRPIQNRNLLKDGFRIQVGSTQMVFRMLG